MRHSEFEPIPMMNGGKNGTLTKEWVKHKTLPREPPMIEDEDEDDKDQQVKRVEAALQRTASGKYFGPSSPDFKQRPSKGSSRRRRNPADDPFFSNQDGADNSNASKRQLLDREARDG